MRTGLLTTGTWLAGVGAYYDHYVTIQVVPPIGGVLLLLCPFIILALMVLAAVELGRRRARDATSLAGLVGAVLVLYMLALLGAGVLSTPQQLTVADTKCFDD